MLSVDITIAFPRQLEEYALFSDGDNDYGINYQTYVRVAFWIKTESGYVACVSVGITRPFAYVIPTLNLRFKNLDSAIR